MSVDNHSLLQYLDLYMHPTHHPLSSSNTKWVSSEKSLNAYSLFPVPVSPYIHSHVVIHVLLSSSVPNL